MATAAASSKAQAQRIRRFLKDQQRAVNLTAKAGDIERHANSAMRRAVPESVPAEVDKALDLYHRAGAAYREAIAFMRAVKVPRGLRSFRDLTAAQSGYADVLDEWPQASWEGPPKGIRRDFWVAWRHYQTVLRRYNAALIRACARAGVKPRPWLLVPPMGQSDSGV